MKKPLRYASMFLGAAMLLQVQGCYGQFALTRKLYAWNGTVGDKWVKSIVMFALCVIPVYELAGFADWALLNTIQFWTGKSPVVLKEGEKEIQMVEYKGNQYRLTATTNRLDVQQIVDGKPAAPVSLLFDVRTQSWVASASGARTTLMEMLDGDGRMADVIYPDGHKQRVEMTGN